MKKFKDIYYTDKKDIDRALDIYIPDSENALATLIYIHGGGLGSMTKELSMDNISKLTEKNIAVVSVEYRKITYAPYPLFLKDCAAAIDWILQNMKDYISCDKFFVGGSSAGSYISMMLCFDRKYLGEHGIDSGSLAGYIFDAGQPTTHLNVLSFSGEDSRKIVVDDRAPLYHICENWIFIKDNLIPPMCILCAENDMAGRYEQTLLMMATLKNYGYPEDKMEFHYMKGYNHCQYNDEPIFIEIIEKFIKENI